MPENGTACTGFSEESVWPKPVITSQMAIYSEGKLKKKIRKPKFIKSYTKQNKKDIKLEKLPKYVTNTILLEGKRDGI